MKVEQKKKSPVELECVSRDSATSCRAKIPLPRFMTATLKKILVVGGNGFIGSAVCRAALAKGMQVTSVSSSGRPYRTPKGHSPAWASKVTWLQGNALEPSSFAENLEQVDDVVHTLGTLLEGGDYKQAVRDGNPIDLAASFLNSRLGFSNPLNTEESKTSYEVVNRDSALRVCEAFVASGNNWTSPLSRAFVYISAEDVFRPLIPAKYLDTKREAERGIETIISATNSRYRGIYIRPSLVYHAHLRPMSTPAAALLDLASVVQSKISTSGLPTPSAVLRSLGTAFESSSDHSSSLESIANALSIPPIHVDHVAEAICAALLDSGREIHGVVGVKQMRELLGLTPSQASSQYSHV
ncbi:mitochondrial protein [Mycena floridula]|nr:mitochondrial protein [Mycena floridula]